jgi:hypothetical protein
MTTQTFSSVASNVVGQYTQVGKLIVGAYRTGAQRLVGGANARYAAFLDKRALPLVNEAVKASLIDAQKQIANAVVGTIVTGTERAEQAIDLLADGVNGGIERVAATAERVESAFNTSALTTVGTLTMPVAQISLEIANRAVEGTKRLSDRVIGADAEIAEVVAAPKRAAKKAVRRIKARA